MWAVLARACHVALDEFTPSRLEQVTDHSRIQDQPTPMQNVCRQPHRAQLVSKSSERAKIAEYVVTHSVSVLYSQNPLPARLLRVQVVVERCPEATEMQSASWRGCEAEQGRHLRAEAGGGMRAGCVSARACRRRPGGSCSELRLALSTRPNALLVIGVLRSGPSSRALLYWALSGST